VLAASVLYIPLSIWLLVVTAPAGRSARRTMILTGLPMGMLWISGWLGIGPFFSGGFHSDKALWSILSLYTGGWGLAVLTQIVGRPLQHHWQFPGGYGVIALLLLVLAGALVVWRLGF